MRNDINFNQLNFNNMFSGNYTALITPFKNGKVDENALAEIIEFQIKNGVSGIVPCGTTGESPTLNHDEHNLVVKLAVKIANKRIKVIAGTGSNSTEEAVQMTKYAKEVGADGCLIVTPYYNKPTPDGIYQHFQALDKCRIPLIVYNIPGRCVVNISDDLIAKMANDFNNVVGIKDATGDLARIASLRGKIKKEFSYLSGEDITAVGFNAMGGNGVISVTANVAPKLCSQLQQFCLEGKYDEALKIQDKLLNLHLAMFCETNPIPVKYAMSLIGFCSDEIRLPLCNPNKENQERIKKELKNLGLL